MNNIIILKVYNLGQSTIVKEISPFTSKSKAFDYANSKYGIYPNQWDKTICGVEAENNEVFLTLTEEEVDKKGISYYEKCSEIINNYSKEVVGEDEFWKKAYYYLTDEDYEENEFWKKAYYYLTDEDYANERHAILHFAKRIIREIEGC